jgi:hypothetical protein
MSKSGQLVRVTPMAFDHFCYTAFRRIFSCVLFFSHAHPELYSGDGGPGWTRTSDPTLIKRVL